MHWWGKYILQRPTHAVHANYTVLPIVLLVICWIYCIFAYDVPTGRIFQDCILQAIRDSANFFHISMERIAGISLEYEALLVQPVHTPDRAGRQAFLFRV